MGGIWAKPSVALGEIFFDAASSVGFGERDRCSGSFEQAEASHDCGFLWPYVSKKFRSRARDFRPPEMSDEAILTVEMLRRGKLDPVN
jgi:hypothetical protein